MPGAQRAAQAREWTYRLAELGDADACADVGRDIRQKAEFRYLHGARKADCVGELEEALEWFRRAYEADWESAVKDVAEVLCELERYEEAVPFLEQAVEIGERDGDFVHELKSNLKSARNHVARQEKRAARSQAGAPKPSWWRRGG
ncbi:tetratricopeptide repeat protein [Kitasatospora sp. NPDC097643]|uniref:tetratricopeptide repeat protein n=1 Tax=Kitasatospora sp. NPDC097643 TaxID=3157230 RepID=UPI00331B9F8E